MKKEKRLRDVRVAVTILILLVALATANVVTSGILLKSLAKEVETVSIGKAAEAETLYKKFTRVAFFLSITVNHDDLEDAEELMAELNVAVRGEDAEEILRDTFHLPEEAALLLPGVVSRKKQFVPPLIAAMGRR